MRHKEGSLASARNSAPICITYTGCPKINIPNRRSNNVTGNCARTLALDVLSSSTLGAWGGVVLRHCATSRRVPGSIPGHWGFFPGHQTVPCALGSSLSKNKYQDIPRGKDGRCVRVRTLPPSCAECLEILEP